jgi:hypothetical protein
MIAPQEHICSLGSQPSSEDLKPGEESQPYMSAAACVYAAIRREKGERGVQYHQRRRVRVAERVASRGQNP